GAWAVEARAGVGARAFDRARWVVIEVAGRGRRDLVADPSGRGSGPPVQIEVYRPGEVRLSVDMPAEGYLVLADSYFPGWRATEGKTELPILRADRVFRAVHLTPGRHSVTFRYFPESFRLRLYGSFLS